MLAVEFSSVSGTIVRFLKRAEKRGAIDGSISKTLATHPHTLAEKRFNVHGVLFEERYANRARKNIPTGDFKLILKAHTNGQFSLTFNSIGQDPENIVRNFQQRHFSTPPIAGPLMFSEGDLQALSSRLREIGKILDLSAEAFEKRVAKRKLSSLFSDAPHAPL